MRVGATIFVQNYKDWDRYETEERGETAPNRPTTSDRSIFLKEIDIARIADATGFDSVWTVEHHLPGSRDRRRMEVTVQDLSLIV